MTSAAQIQGHAGSRNLHCGFVISTYTMCSLSSTAAADKQSCWEVRFDQVLHVAGGEPGPLVLFAGTGVLLVCSSPVLLDLPFGRCSPQSLSMGLCRTRSPTQSEAPSSLGLAIFLLHHPFLPAAFKPPSWMLLGPRQLGVSWKAHERL